MKAKKSETVNEALNSKNTWKLYTDGASNFDGSGASLMLVSLEGNEYTYALRFELETTNNEAEYEALVAGLRIAEEMEINDLAIFIDSQLALRMLKVSYEKYMRAPADLTWNLVPWSACENNELHGEATHSKPIMMAKRSAWDPIGTLDFTNEQSKETPFILTYGSEAIILKITNLTPEEEKSLTQERTKKERTRKKRWP
ncbi:reverse transcriptase domain-containing protein [Tanacetum coccineum]